MHMYRLAGTYYDVGVEYGTLLHASRFSLPPITPAQVGFAAKCEKRVAQHAPELLDELDGMIAGSRYHADHLKALALTLNIPPACSIVAIAGQHTADGRPLFGRNHDWYAWYGRCAALVEVQIPGELAAIGGNDLFIGRHDGLNEAGLAIGITNVMGGRHTPGVMFPLAVRHVLHTCRTTEQAEAYLEGIPYIRNTNFLIADAAGTIAMVEASPRRVNVTYAADGFAVVTNHFQTERMALLENTKYRPATSLQRLYRLRAWFDTRQSPVTLDSLKAILSAPYPAGMWNPAPKSRRPFGTVWSWAAQLGDRALHFASPDRPRYQCFSF